MNIKKISSVALALAVVGAGAPSRASARQSDKRTCLTFSQAVSIPGRVLPARLIATIMAVPDHRVTPTGDTVIVFAERPIGAPKAITHWFYPGDTEGQEFVY